MNLPNKITLVRICLIPIMIVFFMLDVIKFNFIIATAIFAVASFTDFLDGYIARKYKLVTDLGKFLDPIADKLLVISALVLLIYSAFSMGVLYVQIMVIIVIITLAREFVISALRLIAATKNVVLAADKLGKLKTVVQIIAVLVLMPFADIQTLAGGTDVSIVYYIGLAILVLATLLTLISGINYFAKNIKVFSEKSE